MTNTRDNVFNRLKTQKNITKYVLASELTTTDLHHLMSTSKEMYALFKPAYQDRALQALLNYIVTGNEKKAEQVLKSDPSLLLKKGNTEDYSSRKIKGVTPLQAILGCRDVFMCKMMMPYFDKLFSNKDQRKQAILGQVKEYYETAQDNSLPEDSQAISYIDDIIKAMQESNNETVEKKLMAFRQYFAPQIIKQGDHWSATPLSYAMDLYKEIRRKHQFKENQETVFASQVIGYLERSLPAWLAQFICHDRSDFMPNAYGFDEGQAYPCRRSLNGNLIRDENYHYFLDKTGFLGGIKQELTRNFDLAYETITPTYFPLDQEPHNRLGFHYAIQVLHRNAKRTTNGDVTYDFSNWLPVLWEAAGKEIRLPIEKYIGEKLVLETSGERPTKKLCLNLSL